MVLSTTIIEMEKKMGNRVSIQFKNKDMEWGGESVVLFHHWGGQKFADFAKDWTLKLKEDVKKFSNGKGNDPFSRLEPRNIMVQFIKALSDNYRYIEDNEFVSSDEYLSHSIYLGKDENDGDNSDNGNHVIELS